MDFIGMALLPEGISVLQAIILIVASFFTSALTAAIGVGGGVFMLALMGTMVPVAALIPVHGAVQLGSNTGRAWRLRQSCDLSAALPFMIGSIIGAGLGGALVIQLPDFGLKFLLATFILIVTWTKIPGFDRLSTAGMAAGSAIIAFISLFVGATGPLLAAFFGQIFPGDRKRVVATHALGMSVHHALKIIALAITGFVFTPWIGLVIAMIITGYGGTIWGAKALEKLPEQKFRLYFKIALTLLAFEMIRRGVFALSV